MALAVAHYRLDKLTAGYAMMSQATSMVLQRTSHFRMRRPRHLMCLCLVEHMNGTKQLNESVDTERGSHHGLLWRMSPVPTSKGH